MTWEEIIVNIRSQPKYHELIENCYLTENLNYNVEQFRQSEEFLLTMKLISKYNKNVNSLKLLDVGAGNGIASMAFSLEGYNVTAIEPDNSDTVGTGAIKKLSDELGLNIEIINCFGEEIPIPDNTFDIVYVRQAMHHANDLKAFLAELARVTRQNGLLLCIRDHVIFDKKDKLKFFKSHPLHRFYGGENAFTELEYTSSICEAGFSIKEILRFFDSPINYFPLTKSEVKELESGNPNILYKPLIKKLGFIGKLYPIRLLYDAIKGFPKWNKTLDERRFPCRMYSFVSIKT